MPVTLEVLEASETLADHEKIIQRAERLGFRLASFAIGTISGRRGNLLLLNQENAGPPATPVRLLEIAGGLDKNAQETRLNSASGTVVCYGSLLVGGQARNVAALR